MGHPNARKKRLNCIGPKVAVSWNDGHMYVNNTTHVCYDQVNSSSTFKYIYIVSGISGEKLAELLNRHGTFDKVEVALKKWHERKNRFDKKGGWYTKAWLAGKRHWNKSLGIYIFFSKYIHITIHIYIYIYICIIDH